MPPLKNRLKGIRRNAHSTSVLPDGQRAAGLFMIGYDLADCGFHSQHGFILYGQSFFHLSGDNKKI